MNPVRIKTLPWREVDGRVVILSPKTATIHELNPVASFLWLTADGTLSRDEILERITQRFDIDELTAQRDSSEFFAEMDALHLIQWEPNTNADLL